MPRIQHKRGTSANLASVNPTPLAGELVWDSTENAIKIGDGATAWSSLAYVTATPRSHVHDGADITTGTVDYARLPVGSTTSTVCAGDDARLSDARTPTAHKASHATGGSDALTPGDIGAAPAASPTFTGVITVSATSGSAGSYAPSVTFSGDSNTGFGQVSGQSDTASIFTAGHERVRVRSDGGAVFGGGAGFANHRFAIIASLTSAGGNIVNFSSCTAQTGVTLVYGNWTQVGVASGVTLSALHHNYVTQGVFTGAVTTQSGFFVESTLTGATNNYGFRGAIASGTGRWNLYMDGSAQNYLAGNVGIGSGRTSPASALDVNGVITVAATSGSAGSYAPSLTFSGDSNTGFGQVSGQSDTASVFTAGHERVRVDASGRVGINNTAPTVDLEIGTSSSVATRHLAVRRGTAPAYISNALEGGSLATATFAVNARETSSGGALSWSSVGNASFGISAVRLGSTTSGAHVSFWTAAAVNTNPTERVRVKDTGAVRFVPLSADPASGEAGDVYYNSSTNKLRVYNGTSWIDLH